jgi:hypothetical protein
MIDELSVPNMSSSTSETPAKVGAIPELPVWLTKNLVLGWKVTKAFEPRHWDCDHSDPPKPGGHSPADVVMAEAKSIAHHTAIIAQSGSGKSFFLGRLLEEILLKTRSRLLLIDPNSDFRKLAKPKDATEWTTAKYDRVKRRGFLADEPTLQDFKWRWDQVSIRLHGDKPEPPADFLPLKVDWLDYPIDVLAEEINPSRRDEFNHCHRFVNLLADLTVATQKKDWLTDFLKQAHKFCETTPSDDEEKIIASLTAEFGSAFTLFDEKVILDQQGRKYATLPKIGDLRRSILAKDASPGELSEKYALAITHRKFVSSDAIKLYFSKAVDLEKSGVIFVDLEHTRQRRDPRRVEIIDLPSLRDRYYQKLAISTFLEADWALARDEWDRAQARERAEDDTRVPTFIVIEEAHNLIPTDASSAIERKLKEQFRRIAAEGRKFGRFLIMISQRPDKLDRMIMSECDNRAVMRVGSTVLRTTCEVLGLDGVIPRMTDKVLDFDEGRALLVGPWMGDDPAFLISAARRTQEGGRGLRADYWAVPPF